LLAAAATSPGGLFEEFLEKIEIKFSARERGAREK
jgi:hypothetical protein